MRNIIVGLALASFSMGPALALDELKVASGGRGGWEVSVTELGLSADMFKKHGLDVKLSYTEGSGETMQAAISGAVDVALGIGPFRHHGRLCAWRAGSHSGCHDDRRE
jgi:NitT/TauT family transport system substrate-binding protein